MTDATVSSLFFGSLVSVDEALLTEVSTDSLLPSADAYLPLFGEPVNPLQNDLLTVISRRDGFSLQ